MSLSPTEDEIPHTVMSCIGPFDVDLLATRRLRQFGPAIPTCNTLSNSINLSFSFYH